MEKQEFYKRARPDVAGPLDGITVIEATTSWAGPMAGCLLADYGARVIKVEHPTGEVARRLVPRFPGGERLGVPHETVNRNKCNVTVDLETPEGREIFLGLVARADAVVENFRAGTLARWGVGYEDAREVKRDIVYTSISGFGQFGPNCDRPAYDPLAQHFSGWAALNGEPNGEPVKAPTFLGDDLSGIHAALATLAALRHRDRTGEGQHVDVALTDCIFYQSNGHLTSGAVGIPLRRYGNQFEVAAPANRYTCKDGWVFIGVLIDSQWTRIAAAMQREDLAADERFTTIAARLVNREAADALVAEWCRRYTVDEIVRAAVANGVPVTRVNTFAEVADDPQVRERDMLIRTRLCDGTEVPLTGPPAKFSRTPVGIRSAAESLGASTVAVLKELGYSDAQCAQLRSKGVIG
jgi:crotonobetainyl-CoA:carnitine CoA-transferase CaiB-like acyl-CoA transferase